MIAITPRAGDPEQNYARSQRVYNSGDRWFFHTREGRDAGPYDSRLDAEQGVKDFVEFLQVADWDTRLRYLASISEPVHIKSPGN